MHIVPANPNIREDPANTAIAYYADDVGDSDFYIEGAVRKENREQILSFIVINQKLDARNNLIKGVVKGAEFFDAMWSHFVMTGTTIDVIEGEWMDIPLLGTNKPLRANLDAFNKAILIHPTYEDAARDGTITGSYAKKKNYTNVTILHTLPPCPPGKNRPYKDVKVQFRKP